MQLPSLFTVVVIGGLVTSSIPGFAEGILQAVKAMERDLGMTITQPGALYRGPRPTQPSSDIYVGGPVAISPDGNAVAWWLRRFPYPSASERSPFVTIERVNEGRQPVFVEGKVAVGELGISAGAAVIVAFALPLNLVSTSKWELLVIDRRSGAVHDLTRMVSAFEVGNNVEDVNVSGPGSLAALGTREQIQVLQIPGGETAYAGPGRFPRLSPDGKRLAFVNKDKLWIHSFVDGTTKQMMKGKRVKGVGGWSPDGRFLLAGAGTTMLTLTKRQIIVDTVTGEHASIGKLGEGDYGSHFAWVSVKLLTR